VAAPDQPRSSQRYGVSPQNAAAPLEPAALIWHFCGQSCIKKFQADLAEYDGPNQPSSRLSRLWFGAKNEHFRTYLKATLRVASASQQSTNQIGPPLPKAVGCSGRTTVTTFISFARRPNHDSTIDSICTKCYQTIASADNASDLVAYEETHVCDPNGEFNQQHVDKSQRRTSY
jgi:hypothetical protein